MASIETDRSSTCSYFFGEKMRQHFLFANGYRPLNHGSFGAFPREIQAHQRELQSETEARPDTFIRYTYPNLLKESRSALAPLLGADIGEVVLIPNATTGVNTVLRNIPFLPGDIIFYFSTIYRACENTIQSLQNTNPVSSYKIDIEYPITDDEIIRRFRSSFGEVKFLGRRPKLAIFDTVLTFPGVRFPWERLVVNCKELGVMSLIDGAHGIGHIDLTHMGKVGPDFLITNCHKWLMVPRGCAVLYVPFRNQHMISTTIPTSKTYIVKEERNKIDIQGYFSRLFDRVSTTDITPYCCVTLALRFRSSVCGGEAAIRTYCEDVARNGGKRMAQILGTEVLGSPDASFRRCCFVNVRLPLSFSELDVETQNGKHIAKWMENLTSAEYETFIPIHFYAENFWCRISGQVYLAVEDFEWAAQTLLLLCDRVRAREWTAVMEGR